MKKKNCLKKFMSLFFSIMFIITLSIPAFALEVESFEYKNGDSIVADEFQVICFDDEIIPEQTPDGVYIYSGDISGKTDEETETSGDTAEIWTTPEKIEEFEVSSYSKDYDKSGEYVHSFTFMLPGDGVYHEIPDFRGEYGENSTVTVSGSWGPSYAGISVMFVDTLHGGSIESHNILPGESESFGLWKDSTWTMYVCSTSLNVSGNIQVTVT